MDIIQLYQDYSVDFVTEGHKHARPGWVNTPCPFCTGNPGYHLGYDTNSNHYYCWRCGWHPIVPTVAKLINLPTAKTQQLVKKYGLLISKISTEEQIKKPQREHRLPSEVGILSEIHRRYLINRGFDPDKLYRTWALMGTGPYSVLDKIDFKFRIIIPILWNGVEVSFTSRDITNRHNLRYITCPKSRELIEHKQILYGRQEYWGKTAICVEGPTDVWRFGVNAFGTFGIQYTPIQLRLMARLFKRIAVIYDDDPQAIAQSRKLVAELRFRNVDAFPVDIEGDPGSMSQNEANYLVKQLIH